MSEQLFKRQPVLRPVMTQRELFDVSVSGGLMQVTNRVSQWRQLVVARKLFGQPVRQTFWAEQAKALYAKLAQALAGMIVTAS